MPAATPALSAAPVNACIHRRPMPSAGGRLHGVVKSGDIPLPGVTVTAVNTLTGKRYSTTTDISGSWSLSIPQNGRYVIRTQFAAFAQASQEALLNETGHDRTVNFQLILASRAAEQEQRAELQSSRDQGGAQAGVQQAIQEMAGNAPENLSLVSALSADTETGNGRGRHCRRGTAVGGRQYGFRWRVGGHQRPVRPGEPHGGRRHRRVTRAAAGIPPAEWRSDAGRGRPVWWRGWFRRRRFWRGFWRRGAFGGGGFGGGGRGGFGGGGFGGGRGNFRGFNPGQPHGAIFWEGSNAALNAEPSPWPGSRRCSRPAGPTASASRL